MKELLGGDNDPSILCHSSKYIFISYLPMSFDIFLTKKLYYFFRQWAIASVDNLQIHRLTLKIFRDINGDTFHKDLTGIKKLQHNIVELLRDKEN